MYCSACGQALSRQMKYCNHCGAQLSTAREREIKEREKRLDDYIDGIFWVTIFGLGMILGGMFLIKQVLHLSEGLMIAYLAVSATAFLTVFGMCLWQIIAMARGSTRLKAGADEEEFETNKLTGREAPKSLAEGMNITEETTRTLETIPNDHANR